MSEDYEEMLDEDEKPKEELECKICKSPLPPGDDAYATVGGEIHPPPSIEDDAYFWLRDEQDPWLRVLCSDCGDEVEDFIEACIDSKQKG